MERIIESKHKVQYDDFCKFISECSTKSNSLKNYTDFKRINECLAIIFPEIADISILDFTDPLEFVEVVKKLNKNKQYIDYNRKGNNQYSNTVSIYQDFLWAKKFAGLLTYQSLESSAHLTEVTGLPLQCIYYGAPGTGKSFKINEEVLKGVDDSRIFRTTFHPDTDYASFVGCYKPKMEDKDISYEFVPQVFTDAYIKAWSSDEPVYLVIEEINRGNCAQIFGDLFQLLDRKNGVSEYSIKADKDLCKYLTDELGTDNEGIADGNLKLPANFNILATMNTSDQSLFPMDSAFKRRWEWEYVPINPDHEKAQFHIKIGDKEYLWPGFLKEINTRIKKSTDSEDKQMGEFFIKHNVDEKEFKSKVMFYLWSEICKDNPRARKNIFMYTKDGKENDFVFNGLYGDNSLEILDGFMKFIGVAVNETK